MIVLLAGKDRFRLVRRRAELRRGFLSKYPDGMVVVIDASERGGSVAAAIAEAGASGLFSAKTLLDVREALSLPVDEAKKVKEALKGLGDDVSVIFSQSIAPKAKDEPYAFLRKHAGKTESFDELSSREAEAFIRTEVSAVAPSVSFSREALALLFSACDGDSARLSSEAIKLALYKGDGEVSRSDADVFMREAPQETVFAALDALVSGNRGRAAELLLREARADSGGVQKLFGLLAWQIRELFRVRGEYDRGNTRADDIARATGMKAFTAGKLAAKMGVFPLPRLKAALILLSDLDADMKSGKIDPELALTLFVDKL